MPVSSAGRVTVLRVTEGWRLGSLEQNFPFEQGRCYSGVNRPTDQNPHLNLLLDLIWGHSATPGSRHADFTGAEGPAPATDQRDDEGLVVGARNGGRLTSALSGWSQPAAGWMRVTVTASSGQSGGRRPGRRSASMVLPEPGGPIMPRVDAPIRVIAFRGHAVMRILENDERKKAASARCYVRLLSGRDKSIE